MGKREDSSHGGSRQQQGLLQKNTIFLFSFRIRQVSLSTCEMPSSFFPQPVPLREKKNTTSLASLLLYHFLFSCLHLLCFPPCLLFFPLSFPRCCAFSFPFLFFFFSALSSRSEEKYGAVNQKARWSAGVCCIFKGGWGVGL